MSIQPPFKLLEINVISAHDLPPVSKMLRTFAVAYVHPDNKLTTKIDHQGHTNPTWNYKFAFHVDDKFLKNESSAVTIEIYNLAWLRDLPIGTAHLMVNSISPPLLRNPGYRRVSIRVCRPSGHLQGTLNLGVQLVDNNVVPGCERSPFSVKNDEEVYEEDEVIKDENQEKIDFVKEDDFQGQEMKSPGSGPGPSHSASLSRMTSRRESEHETKTVATSGAGSFYSVMRPLPSEVAADLKKGVYIMDWNDYGSSIFDNWTDQGDKSDDFVENTHWPIVEDQIPLSTMSSDSRPTGGHWKSVPEKKKKKKGLFSCFGNAYGFQFSFSCGSKNLKKKKNKNRNVNKHNIHLMSLPENNLRRCYD
ncbi:hypothetical protein CASFOL_003707 [Castilleja foliolosa]|uniref:C2 domain-containing protein n=1 Tax=Castilleja foliolosa TaxID=1961234 RepID=A0ABD3EL87_9LAMI